MKLRSLGVAPALCAAAFALAFVLAPTVVAQSTAKMNRIGILQPIAAASSAWRERDVWKAFFSRLTELGYAEGRNVVVEMRSAEGRLERLPAAAVELVATGPDVIIAPICGAPLNAVMSATHTIPIVVATCTEDLVATGIVASLARPGGNVTGVQKLAPELAAKRLDLLKQVLPSATRIAVLWNPEYSDLKADWSAVRSAAETLKMTLLPFEARSAQDYAPAFAAMVAQRVDAIFMFTDAWGYISGQALAELAATHRLPAIYPFRETALAGGLIAYGPSIPDMFRLSAGYVAKILRGASPSELPIEQPTRFELVINLKSAKALGITIPQTVLLRADEIIQ